MITINDFAEADDVTNEFIYGPEFATIAEPLRKRLKSLSSSPSPVDRLSILADTIYANAANLPNSAKELGAAAAAFMAQNSFHGMGGEKNRGGRIAQALRRDAGIPAPEGMEWPEPSSDPAPTASFVVELEDSED